MRDFALTISKILKDYNLTTQEVKDSIVGHIFTNMFSLTPEDKEELFELMLDSTELATLIVLFANNILSETITRYIKCLSGEDFLDNLKNRSNISEYSEYIVNKLKGKAQDDIPEVKYHKLKIRETITNVTLADKFMEDRMCFLYLQEDLDQMRNLHKILRNIDNMYPDGKTIKGFYDLDSKTMKMMYDSAVLLLDIDNNRIKNMVLDNVDKIYQICNEAWTKDTGILYKVISGDHSVKVAIFELFDIFLTSIGSKVDEIQSLDHIKRILSVINCISEMIWYNILKEYVHNLAVTLDEEDFIVFIYYMFQITRYNYNTPIQE